MDNIELNQDVTKDAEGQSRLNVGLGVAYPTKIDLCDGKYTVIYDLKTGQSECLRYGEKWRELCGDKMVMAMFDEIVALREAIEVMRVAGGASEFQAAFDRAKKLIVTHNE